MNMDEQQLPLGWVQTTLSELTHHKSGNSKLIKGKLPAEKSDRLFQGFSASGPDVWCPSFEHEGDAIIVSAVGARCGKAFRASGKWSAIANTHIVWPDHDVIDVDYLHRLLNDENFWIKGGSAQPFVKTTATFERPFLLPPLKEQRRIVAKIEALQERSGRAAKTLEEVGPLLEQFRQSILAAAFSGRLTADWREKNPNVESAHEHFARIRIERRQRWEQAELAKYESKGKEPPKDWKDKYEEPEPVDETNLPELPQGWCWARAEEVCEYITKGTTPPTEKMTQDRGEVRFLKVGNLTFNGLLDFTKENAYIDHDTHNAGVYSRSRILPGDVLMNLVGPPLGKVSIIPPEIEHSNVNQAIAIFRPIAGIQPRYLMLALTTPSILQRILDRAKQTSGQRNLTLELARGLPVPLAPHQEQNEIIRLSQLSLNVFTSLEMALPNLESDLTQLNQSILAKAFRGELVPQDPNDEPASELLARIRREREVSGDRVQGSGRKKKARRKGTATVSAPPAKRSKRSSTAASATTPDASTDPSPEPARPQRRRRRSSSISEDPSLVIRVLAEGGAVNIHADTSGPTVQFYTKSSGGGFLAEIEDIPESALQPRESKRVATLRDIMEPDLALLYPKDVNETYLPQLRDWYTWAAPQLPEHFESEFLEQAKFRWLEALEISAVSGTAAAALRRSDGRLFDS
jgi:type I restriction enzyme S subunit